MRRILISCGSFRRGILVLGTVGGELRGVARRIDGDRGTGHGFCGFLLPIPDCETSVGNKLIAGAIYSTVNRVLLVRE